MKKILALIAILLGIYFFYTTFQRISPPYFIKIADQQYKFEDFFKQSLTRKAYEVLDKQQKLSRIYEQLKLYLCQPDCNITIFSFEKAPINPQIEGLFYRHDEMVTKEIIQQGRIELAREQYFFSILDKTLIIINDPTMKLKVESSPLPWIGKTQDGLLVEFIYAANFNEWFKPWVLRFIRDYRKFVKIYLLPYEAGGDFTQQAKAAICLKEKRVFWDLYFNDRLDLQHQTCETNSVIPIIPQDDLAVRLGSVTYKTFKSYGELAKNFQISYLALKLR